MLSIASRPLRCACSPRLFPALAFTLHVIVLDQNRAVDYFSCRYRGLPRLRKPPLKIRYRRGPEMLNPERWEAKIPLIWAP
jgi:hypothetical protein